MECPNCNETDHEPTAKYCHVCGGVVDPERLEFSRKLLDHGRRVRQSWDEMKRCQNVEDHYSGFRWSKVFRWLLLLFLLAEYIFISIPESHIDSPWGGITVFYMNGFVFFMTLVLCIFANQGHFKDKKRGWRLYYEWLHFFTAAFVPLIGNLIVSYIQNLWTLILESLLIGMVLLTNFGTLEDLF